MKKVSGSTSLVVKKEPEKKTEKQGYIVFNASGLPEKELMATVVVSRLKQAHPEKKIVVISQHVDIWLHNPDVYRVYRIGSTPYFYEEYIRDKDTTIFWQDPYNTSDYMLGRTHKNPKHLVDIWSELCGLDIPLIKKEYTPRLFFTFREREATGRMIGIETDTRPLFFIQTQSGLYPDVPYVWSRDIPKTLAIKAVDLAVQKGFRVIHLCTNNEQPLANTEWLNFGLRQILCAISFAQQGLFIHSYAQHVAAFFNIPMLVLWVADKPERVGYAGTDFTHVHNILPSSEDQGFNDYLSSFSEQFLGKNGEHIRTCPFSIEKYYSSDDIIKNL